MTINDLPNLEISRTCYALGLDQVNKMIGVWQYHEDKLINLRKDRKRIEILLNTVNDKIAVIEIANTPFLDSEI